MIVKSLWSLYVGLYMCYKTKLQSFTKMLIGVNKNLLIGLFSETWKYEAGITSNR